MLHLALKAFYPSQAAVPAAARRHDLEVPRDVRVPRPDGRASSASSCSCTRIPEALAQGINPFTHGSARAHRHLEDAGAEAGARQARLRRRLRRRAARRGEVARQGARVLVPLGAAPLGSRRTSAPSCGASTTRASSRARRSACSRSRTGPSSTSGSTSTSRRSRSCRSTSPAERPVVERDGTLIMVDDERMPLAPGETPMLRKVRFRTLGCYPLTGAVESDADTLPAIIQEMLLTTHVRAPGPRDRPRLGRLDGEEEAGGLLLSGPRVGPDLRGHPRLPRRARAARACCASSPAAASTTARAR